MTFCRLSTQPGGDPNGGNLQTLAYTPNLLNQYTQREVRVHWSQEDLLLLSLIVKMMELDPTFKRLEEFFEQGADLMRRLRARPKTEEDLATNGTKRHEEEGDL